MNNNENFTPENFLQYCLSAYSWRQQPWKHPELNHGTALLHSEEGMNAYMAAYGEMHILKCRVAMQNLQLDLLKLYSFEIFDWGCGQGIASMCLIEKLQQRDLLRNLRRVTLVEPSPETLNRAKYNVGRMLHGNPKVININAVNSYLPGTADNKFTLQIDYQSHIAIHLFSNILDINSIDLMQLAKSIANNENTQHIILCIGPKNSNCIDLFWEIFGLPECFTAIRKSALGHTQTGHPISCLIRCFEHKGLIDKVSDETNNKLTAQDVAIQPHDDYDEQYDESDRFMKTLLEVKHRFERMYPNAFIIIQPELKCQSPDLMVIIPRQGVIIAQIFADDITVTKTPNPASLLEYLDLCQKNVVDMLSTPETFTKNWSRDGVKTVKKIAVFACNSSEEANTFFFNNKKYTILLGSEKLNDNNFLDTVHFRFDRPELFSDDRRQLLINQITTQWHSWQDGKPINLSEAQKKLAKSSRTSQKISGVAGSGKTQVLVHRAVNAQIRTGGKILILCFNKSLVNYIGDRLNEVPDDFLKSRFTIRHYHGFIKDNLNKAVKTKETLLKICDDINKVKQCLDEKAQKYDAIFVDEVQDYKTEWLRILQQLFLVAPDDEFVVFGDPKQNVYNRELDKNGDIQLGIIKSQWNHDLSKSYRFIKPQLEILTQDFRKQFLPDMNNAPAVQLDINDTTIIRYANIHINNELEKLAKWIPNCINKYDLDVDQTVILAVENEFLRQIDEQIKTKYKTVTTFGDAERRSFSMTTPGLKISSIHSFKGLEATNIILIIQNFDTTNYHCKNPPHSVIYTAITRTREKLFIFNLGNAEYDDFFKTQRM